MKHTKEVGLQDAMDRIGLTQMALEAESGVDRTRISRLLKADDPQLLHSNYERLDAALRRLKALKPSEKLVIRAAVPA